MGNICFGKETNDTSNLKVPSINEKKLELTDTSDNSKRDSEYERESTFISSPMTSNPSFSSNRSFQESKTSVPPFSSAGGVKTTIGIDSTTRQSGPNTQVPFASASTTRQSGPNTQVPFSSSGEHERRESRPNTRVPFASSEEYEQRESGPNTQVPFSSIQSESTTESRDSIPRGAPPPIPLHAPPSIPSENTAMAPSSSSIKRPSMSIKRPSMSVKRPSINQQLPMIPTIEKIKAIKELIPQIESNGYSQELFKYYFDMAMAYQDLDDNENTVQNYTKCLEIASEIFKPDDTQIADVNFRLGVTMYKIKNYHESRLYLANVIDNESMGKDDQLVLLSYYYLGLLNKELKNLDEATELLYLAYSGLKLTLPNSVDFLNCAYELADLYSNIDLDQATVYVMEASIGRNDLLGVSHIDTIHAMELYGRILMSSEDYEKASMILRTVTSGYVTALGPKESVTLKAKFSLGLCLQFLGQMQESISLFEETAEAFEKIYGLNQDYTADSTFKLAIALSAIGEMGEATNKFRRCLEIYKVIEGENSHNGYLCHYYLGLLLFQSGNKIEEGRYHLQIGIDALVDAFGKDSEEVLEAYDLLNSNKEII